MIDQNLVFSNKRKLSDHRDKKQSKTSSLFNVIKKRESILIKDVFRSNAKTNARNEVLKSIISSQKESLYPLAKILGLDEKVELMKTFHNFVKDNLKVLENFGYFSKNNILNLLNNKEEFNKLFNFDLHIFNSEQIRFSLDVLVFRGKIGSKCYDLLLNKRKIKWFVANCANTTIGYSERLKAFLPLRDEKDFIPENLSLLLLRPMFLPNSIVITRAFVVIY